mmetsp:Transcript_128738/g.412415  ORF Transcript_128738/g.412415 Transcript_128738/m.412415 type:complete len:92 (+) Transcript_128738:582-857(+)
MNEPINGALKLKLDGSGESVRLEFYLFVGLARQGPFVCDFEEKPVQEIAFDVNIGASTWRRAHRIFACALSFLIERSSPIDATVALSRRSG